MELDQAEGFLGRQKMDDRAFFSRITHHFKRGDRFAMMKLHEVLFAVTVNRQFQPLGQRVDHRHAHAVQAAGYLVGIAVEFAARMQDGHDNFGGGTVFFLVDIGWNAAPVVADTNRVVRMNNHVNFVAMTRQSLIYGIVHRLEHHMMQTGAVIRVADIHTGTFAHGFQPF